MESRERTVHRGKKTYISNMYLLAGGTEPNLTVTSNAQRDELHTLLCDMVAIPPPDSYRRYATARPTYTIVERTVNNRNYRIDNQMRLDLSEPNDKSRLESGPRLNIHYQIDRNSHAMALVRMKPIVCPDDIEETVGLIDEIENFGFRPATVMGCIENALKHSAANRCYTYIIWTIKEVERTRPRHPSGDDSHALVRTATKIAAKIAETKGVSFVLKKGTKAALTKVPLLGLGIGLVYAVGRLINGDLIGAIGEVASGAASVIPGIGTAASLGVDAILLAHDLES